MQPKKSNKKKMYLITIICISLVGLFLLLGSYAFWRIKGEQSESNYVVGACLNFEFIELKDEETGEINQGINLGGEETWPMSDEDGSKQKGYSFKIENTCNRQIDYQVVLESLKIAGKTANDYFDDSEIKVQFDNASINTYNTLKTVDNDDTASYIEDIRLTKQLLVGTLGAKEKVTQFSGDLGGDLVWRIW